MVIDDVGSILVDVYDLSIDTKWFIFGSAFHKWYHQRSYDDYIRMPYKNSDIDIVVIHDEYVDELPQIIVVNDKQYDVQFISNEQYQDGLLGEDIRIIELMSYPYLLNIEHVTNITDFNHDITANIRRTISSKSSHSYVKAKKKIDIEDDYVSSVKSMFHSFRILNYGIQIGKHGYIKDFFNEDLVEVCKLIDVVYQGSDVMSDIAKVLKPEYNKRHSEFKRYFPKKK